MTTQKEKADRIVQNLKRAARLGGEGGTYTGDATASDDDSQCSLGSIMAAAVMGIGYASNDGSQQRLDEFVEAHQYAERFRGVCAPMLQSAIKCLREAAEKGLTYDPTPALEKSDSVAAFRAWIADGCDHWTWTGK